MFLIAILCCISLVVTEKDVIRAKRQQTQTCSNGGQNLFKSCKTSTDCNGLTNSNATCLNQMCCTNAPLPNNNQTGPNANQCPIGYQSLFKSCTTPNDCSGITNSQTLCNNGQCCAALNNTNPGNPGNGNGNNQVNNYGNQNGNNGVGNPNSNVNPNACSTGTSLGIRCNDTSDCAMMTNAPVTCQSNVCCATINQNQGNQG